MIEVHLMFKDGDVIVVKLPEHVALEWQKDDKVRSDLFRCGVKTIEIK